MTGNTNVKDGISLNAIVVTKEVETGQSVIAGNFVQYKTVSSTQTTNVSLSPTSDELDLIQNVSGEYYVGLFRDNNTYNSLKLLKINNSGIKFLDTFAVNETQCFSFCIQSGNIYACFGKVLYRFRIESDEFVIDDSLDFSPDYTTSGAVFNLIYYNGKLFAIARDVDIIVFDVSQSTMAYFNKYSSFLNANTNRRCKLVKAETNYLALYCVSVNYVGTNQTYGIYKCNINNDGTVTDKTSILSYTEGNNSSIAPIYASWIDTETFVMFSQGSAANHKIVDIINIAQNSRTTTSLYDVDSTSVYYYAHRINTTRFAINMWNANQLFIATVNKNTNTITLTSNKLSTLRYSSRDNGSSEPIIIGKEVYVFGTSNTENKVVRQYMNDNYDYLYNEEDRDYVRNWDGESKLIGVAKQSGSAGETIEVYVPEV